MDTPYSPVAERVEQELVIERIFDAPRKRVWKALTNRSLLKRWWGPKDFTAPEIRLDLREGGRYLFCMRSPDGRDYWSTGVYRKIVPEERIEYTDSFADEKGNVVPASHYGMKGEWPLELHVTLTLEELGSKTKLTLRHEGLPAGQDSADAKTGWNQSLDKLAESLK